MGGGPQEGSVGHISPCETTKKKAGKLVEEPCGLEKAFFDESCDAGPFTELY